MCMLPCSTRLKNYTIAFQVVEKELLIQEKEKLYMELKQILQRQPGPEVAEQLQIYQQTLKEKTKQMKVCLYDMTHVCMLPMSLRWVGRVPIGQKSFLTYHP